MIAFASTTFVVEDTLKHLHTIVQGGSAGAGLKSVDHGLAMSHTRHSGLRHVLLEFEICSVVDGKVDCMMNDVRGYDLFE